ncbi:hypothetical protein [Curtobacterium poinsettiae]|uniref:hypothetical protein n=1 Tax=Curtobacterium TaxID=2034 RepID=UPI00217D51F7|nr:hypothetical protein [Curtobacterium flaccumfaciens]MCS6562462.1 hypothetical protein [Curtobacterium flaccumfaciens pv. poinsettiae]UXN28518.1 hypothetical protein N8D75_16240 [Curtobacterium flaccumfaciens]
MTLTGLNRRTQATFPVDVATDASYVFIRSFVLEPRNPGPGIDLLITLGYAVGADGPPAGISLLAVIGATVTDPVTRSDLHPRVYDEWGPVTWAARPASIRIAAPLSTQYWDAPTAADVDLHVTVWRALSSASS